MKLNINKLFPFLSIRTKLIIAFSMLSFIPLLVVGSIGIFNNMNTMQNFAFDNLRHDVAMINERARKFLAGIQQDIQYLTNSPIFLEYLHAIHLHDGRKRKEVKALLLHQLLTFLRTKNIYYQIHFIDAERNEHFKIQYLDSSFVVIPENQLGDSRFTFYFLLTDSLARGELAFVPAEHLDLRGRKIAAISFATRVFSSGGTFEGLFLVDIFARHLFEVLETPSILRLNRKIAIISSEGHYLYHSQKKKDWNRLLATRETETLFEDYDNRVAREIVSGREGIIKNKKDELLAYAPLFSARFPGGNSYFLMEGVEKKFIFHTVRHFAFLFIPLLLFFLFLSVIFGYLATSQLAGPVKKLQRGAEIITQGNYSHRLLIETNDEIEQLALQFNKMAEAIRERELLLEGHQKKLEEMVHQRTFELQDERDKLQAILDNVPSAILLIDGKNKIISASAAIERIARLSPREVIGKYCYEVYWQDGACDFCPRNQPVIRDTWQPRVRTITMPDGETMFIEHLTVPFSMKFHKNVTLEIITDVTERKKLENHLLKIEKLIATGEMSAVIAHEMRNSLTSVKMILQLQREKSLGPQDEQSVEVAIDSIQRMETVLDNLLRFAKPSPFEFEQADINQIVEESLLFVQPRINKARIEVVKKFDPDIPMINLDCNHIKEAFFNILLNAVQAIEGDGLISIRTCKKVLTRRLEDFTFSDHVSLTDGNSQYKIVLEKGREVILIEIKDTGRGISKENLDKIFDPFFTTKLSGTGLGLAITKRVINQHGGIVSIQSNSGQGTKVNLFFPI